MRAAGVDAAVLSWTGRPGGAVSDTQGVSTDSAAGDALAAAARIGMGAAIHLEPYEGRSPSSVRDDLGYLVARYPSLYTLPRRPCGDEPRLPVVYVYDAYHNAPEAWAEVLCPGGAKTIRGTDRDVVALATLLGPEDKDLVERGCFDGARARRADMEPALPCLQEDDGV